eukprot:TRINITY_DN2659_c0_g1_i5.p1 TRINITY_DN2659_c0_g1~~TRINITY_DN2659_c0_g1_i5.p1  ORF type:complete len:260 (+),score=24.98 TRINITY_DN2659_c0_g1_i5:215-994(+)
MDFTSTTQSTSVTPASTSRIPMLEDRCDIGAVLSAHGQAKFNISGPHRYTPTKEEATKLRKLVKEAEKALQHPPGHSGPLPFEVSHKGRYTPTPEEAAKLRKLVKEASKVTPVYLVQYTTPSSINPHVPFIPVEVLFKWVTESGEVDSFTLTMNAIWDSGCSITTISSELVPGLPQGLIPGQIFIEGYQEGVDTAINLVPRESMPYKLEGILLGEWQFMDSLVYEWRGQNCGDSAERVGCIELHSFKPLDSERVLFTTK